MRILKLLSGEEFPISEEHEEKLTQLIRQKKDFTINLKGTKIKSSDILGFTDPPENMPSEPRTSPVRGFSQFREVVTSSEWYKRSKNLEVERASH